MPFVECIPQDGITTLVQPGMHYQKVLPVRTLHKNPLNININQLLIRGGSRILKRGVLFLQKELMCAWKKIFGFGHTH